MGGRFLPDEIKPGVRVCVSKAERVPAGTRGFVGLFDPRYWNGYSVPVTCFDGRSRHFTPGQLSVVCDDDRAPETAEVPDDLMQLVVRSKHGKTWYSADMGRFRREDRATFDATCERLNSAIDVVRFAVKAVDDERKGMPQRLENIVTQLLEALGEE